MPRVAARDVPGRAFACGDFLVGFGSDGAITRLDRRSTGTAWATDARRLATVVYQTLSFADYSRFYKEYLYIGGGEDCAPSTTGFPCGSYGNSGLNAANASDPASRYVSPALDAVYVSGSDAARACTLRVEMSMPQDVVEDSGAPQRVWLELSTPKRCGPAGGGGCGTLSATLRVYNKTATRRPEALWVRFQPRLAPGARPAIALSKLSADCAGCDAGSAIDAASVVRNGSARIHAVGDGVPVARQRGGAGRRAAVAATGTCGAA